jgi:hypothetical protein
MNTPYFTHWIDLAALGPEDDDAELRSFVSVDLDELDDPRRDAVFAAIDRADVKAGDRPAGPVPGAAYFS